MPRIMFVDDEIEVLEGIRRNLRVVRKEWDLDFVTSAEHALQKMATEPADVVVTDMRMTAMQGDELIDNLLTSYPATVPIVLSGYADPSIMGKLGEIGVRLLAKPCNVETLITTIRESLNALQVPVPLPARHASTPVFDGACDLEDYLLFLTEGLIAGGHITEDALPLTIRNRLDEYRGAVYTGDPSAGGALPVPRQIAELYPSDEDMDWVQHTADGWVDMLYDKHR